MPEIKLGVIESRFADIIWSDEPLHSHELVKLCEQELSWNRSTTYTVLRKLCDRGIFKNEGGTVSSVLSRQEFYTVQSEQFVDNTFDASLPAFIAAFRPISGGARRNSAHDRRCREKGVSHGRCISQDTEYEHRGRLAYSGRGRATFFVKESAKVAALRSMGRGCHPAGVPFLV
jgi:predicted transcriptional regulator